MNEVDIMKFYFIIQVALESFNFELEELNKLKDELDKKIVRVENMINQLSTEEKFVIKIYYFGIWIIYL